MREVSIVGIEPATTKNGKEPKKQSVMSDTVKTTRFWYRHDTPRARRHLNKEFRQEEKQFFRRFGELLRKYKSRGWMSW